LSLERRSPGVVVSGCGRAEKSVVLTFGPLHALENLEEIRGY
jgi:hypothetical protein